MIFIFVLFFFSVMQFSLEFLLGYFFFHEFNGKNCLLFVLIFYFLVYFVFFSSYESYNFFLCFFFVFSTFCGIKQWQKWVNANNCSKNLLNYLFFCLLFITLVFEEYDFHSFLPKSQIFVTLRVDFFNDFFDVFFLQKFFTSFYYILIHNFFCL